MEILCLLDSSFNIASNYGVEVPGFPNIFKNAFMADLASCDVDTTEVEDHFAQQTFFDDRKYL